MGPRTHPDFLTRQIAYLLASSNGGNRDQLCGKWDCGLARCLSVEGFVGSEIGSTGRSIFRRRVVQPDMGTPSLHASPPGGSSDLDIAITINDSGAIMSSNRHCDDWSVLLHWALTDGRAVSMAASQ